MLPWYSWTVQLWWQSKLPFCLLLDHRQLVYSLFHHLIHLSMQIQISLTKSKRSRLVVLLIGSRWAKSHSFQAGPLKLTKFATTNELPFVVQPGTQAYFWAGKNSSSLLGFRLGAWTSESICELGRRKRLHWRLVTLGRIPQWKIEVNVFNCSLCKVS